MIVCGSVVVSRGLCAPRVMSGDPAWLDGPAPPPLCGADGEETFTYVSIVQRLPAILDSTLSHWRPATDGGLDALAALRAELSDKKGDAVLTADLPAEDSEWNAWLAPLSDAGKTWLTGELTAGCVAAEHPTTIPRAPAHHAQRHTVRGLSV